MIPELSAQIQRAPFYYYIVKKMARKPGFRNRHGIRFLELRWLLTIYFRWKLSDKDLTLSICSQFENVLGNCDSITYNEDGAAEAYALLHFLDRYHRFQVVFDRLSQLGVMPAAKRELLIIDVGTGPGPAMFAVSDFYEPHIWRLRQPDSQKQRQVRIDYVERSDDFRRWLHHFTEVANFYGPSRVQWGVPYHSGTGLDFSDIEFDKHYEYNDSPYGDDCDPVWRKHTEKVRPDVIIFSNFLTTSEQARAFAPQIRNCARYLRHNGLLLVVGAQRKSKKYAPVYEIIDEAVLQGKYSRKAFVAWCKRVQLDNSLFTYDYADDWGEELKGFLADISGFLEESIGGQIPDKVRGDLAEWTKPEYRHQIRWEVTAYKKIAVPRQRG